MIQRKNPCVWFLMLFLWEGLPSSAKMLTQKATCMQTRQTHTQYQCIFYYFQDNLNFIMWIIGSNALFERACLQCDIVYVLLLERWGNYQRYLLIARDLCESLVLDMQMLAFLQLELSFDFFVSFASSFVSFWSLSTYGLMYLHSVMP